MNIILMGFSTTGKSTLLKEIKGEINQNVQLIDSDCRISKNYDNHIYGLFMEHHKKEDPENRIKIMEEISNNENSFLQNLIEEPCSYIAALGPNIHTRTNWNKYYSTVKPFAIFLKADVDTVYQRLIGREEKIYEELGNDRAFGNWNQNVIRKYISQTDRYERLSEEKSKENIAKLINANENYYSKIADSIFDANTLSNNSPSYDSNKKREFIELIKSIINK
jgi:shikimate kinase